MEKMAIYNSNQHQIRLVSILVIVVENDCFAGTSCNWPW